MLLYLGRFGARSLNKKNLHPSLRTYASRDGVNAVKWHTVVDQRTCPVCLSLHGKVWTLDGKPVEHSTPLPVVPPTHDWCRCILIPMAYAHDIPLPGSKVVPLFRRNEPESS